MESTLNIFQSIANSSSDERANYLRVLAEHQCFQSNKKINESIASYITSELETAKSYENGLLLLKTFLVQYPVKIFEQKGLTWLTIITRINTQKKANPSIIDLTCEILGQILKYSLNFPDMSKIIVSNHLTKIVEIVICIPPFGHLSSLQLLHVCMTIYAGPCGPVRHKIAEFLHSFIDSNNDEIVYQAGRCILALQQVQGGDIIGRTSISAWANLHNNLLGSIHQSLNDILSILQDTFKDQYILNQLKLPPIEVSDDPVTKIAQHFTRFHNLCKYLEITLLEVFPVTKSIMPLKVLEIIMKGLSVDCENLPENLNNDQIAVGTLLPLIHMDLLNILSSLILLLRGNLLLFSNYIRSILMDSLKWTKTGPSNGFKRPYSLLRIKIYNVLSLWCKTVNGGSSIEQVGDVLFTHIIDDITPFAPELTLNVSSDRTIKHLSKKAKRKWSSDLNKSNNFMQKHSKSFPAQNWKKHLSDDGNEKVSSAALECLRSILESAGVFILPHLHAKMQKIIIALVLDAIEDSQDKMYLYKDVECRMNLFQALFALTSYPHHLCPPPTLVALQIFSMIQVTEKDLQVRVVCSNFVHFLEKMIHPQKESIFFPADLNAIKDCLITNRINIASDEMEENRINDDHDNCFDHEGDEQDVFNHNQLRELVKQNGHPSSVNCESIPNKLQEKNSFISNLIIGGSVGNLKEPASENCTMIDEIATPEILGPQGVQQPTELAEISKMTSPKKPRICDASDEDTINSDEVVNQLIACFVDDPIEQE